MKTQHVTCNTQQKWTSSDNGPSCPTDTGCLWNLHMCCQHIHSTSCSSPSLRGRPVSELCHHHPGTTESAAAGLRAQVRKRLLDWKRLWWCCTVRARDICGVHQGRAGFQRHCLTGPRTRLSASRSAPAFSYASSHCQPGVI